MKDTDQQQPGPLGLDACLDLVADCERGSWAAERDKLHAIIAWCEINTVEHLDDAATWCEGADAIGGEGAPYVSYTAAESYGAAAKISTAAAQQRMSCALDLQHRLPRTKRRVDALEIPLWRAERIAKATHHLNAEAAAYVDRELAGRALTCGAITIDRIVAEAAARYDAIAQAEREAKAAAQANVVVHHDTASTYVGVTGMSWFTAYATTPDVTKLHDLVCQIAEEQKQAGDESDLGIRKAKALGIIVDRATSAGPDAPTTPGRDKTLYVHVTAHDLITEQTPLGTVEKLGTLTVATIAEWFAGSKVVVRPVLDLARDDAVDQHDAPDWMRETVILRDKTCRFPWCGRDARGCDQDHIDPYIPLNRDGGTGQTSPTKLASLCRRHHNDKTHRNWKYRRLPDGSHLWTSPQGRRYRVDGDQTHAL